MSGMDMALLVLLGVVAGVDTASVPQAMLSRPLVAGSLAGLVAGSPQEALIAAAVLELFALETLPVGASRYPDWGPASVAAGATAAWADAGTPGTLTAVIVGLAFAWVGGWSMHVARRRNAASLAAHRDALEQGDRAALRAVHYAGLRHDLVRSLVVTAAALIVARVMADAARDWHGPGLLASVGLASTATGAALWAGWRLFAAGRSGLLFALGLAAGAAASAAWWAL